jgi:hypothetical protein
MSVHALTEIEKIETERRAAAEARKQELRAVAYVHVESGKPWVSIEGTEAATLHVVQKLLADDAYANIEILTWAQGDKRLEEIILADRRERDAKEREEFARRNTPVVDGPATAHLYSDAHAYAVVSVSKSGKQVKLLRLDAQKLGVEITRLKNYDQGDYPVLGHYYTEDEVALALTSGWKPAELETAYQRKDGRYYLDGSHVTFGQATDLTDHRF